MDFHKIFMVLLLQNPAETRGAIMKKVFCLLTFFVILWTSAGLAQEDKAKAGEDDVLVFEDLKDPKNERRSIGFEVTRKRTEASLEREGQKEQEDAFSEAKQARRAKARRLRGEEQSRQADKQPAVLERE
jgi:hypothetical protein